jgi:hypothetical protein
MPYDWIESEKLDHHTDGLRCTHCGAFVELKIMGGVSMVQKSIDFFESHKKCSEPTVVAKKILTKNGVR